MNKKFNLCFFIFFLLFCRLSLTATPLVNDERKMGVDVFLHCDSENHVLSMLNERREEICRLDFSNEKYFDFSQLVEEKWQGNEYVELAFADSFFFYFRKIWNGISQLFYKGFQNLIHAASPANVWETELRFSDSTAQKIENLGKMVVGDSTYLLYGGPPDEKSHVDHLGKEEFNDKVRLTFINGILNTEDTIYPALDLVSETHGGVNVHYVFRSTDGWTLDVLHAMLIKAAYSLGFRSPQAYLLANLWKDLIQEMGGTESGGVIIHYAHSLGGSDTDRARDLLTLEEQKMIRVVTLGSSTLVRNEGFQDVINIVSINDGLSSMFLNPTGKLQADFDPNIILRFCVHPEAPNWPIDHLLNSPTYRTVLCEMGKKFLEEFR